MRFILLLAAKCFRSFSKKGLGPRYKIDEYYNCKVEPKIIPTDHSDVRVLLYWPQTIPAGKLPVYINLHAGGFILGYPRQDGVFCKRLAHNLGCLVVNVDYALAPEHPFPVGLMQCMGVATWLAANADDLHIDRFRIAVGGHSAGGNFATGVARLLRGRSDLSIVLQIIDYAALDLTISPFQKHARTNHPVIHPRVAAFFDRCYVPDVQSRSDPLVSPAASSIDDLKGMPPAIVITAEYDLLRDEGDAYAEKLRAAGVNVVHRIFEGCDHAFTHMGPKQSAEEAWQLMEDNLRKAFQS